MFEHLTNCHGEWNTLIALIGSAPILGVWLRSKLEKNTETITRGGCTHAKSVHRFQRTPREKTPTSWYTSSEAEPQPAREVDGKLGRVL